jgi:nicotinamide mononucleotide (NMN) deamidase PncC
MPIDSYDSDAEGADELARGAEIRLRWDVMIAITGIAISLS